MDISTTEDATRIYMSLPLPESPMILQMTLPDSNMEDSQTEPTPTESTRIDMEVSYQETEPRPIRFDVDRPERTIIRQSLGISISEETVHEVTQYETTYEIVNRGSERGKSKLVSSDGYDYVHHRTLVSGAVDWRCSIRRKDTTCPGMVKQRGEVFEETRAHNHTSKPGLSTAVKVKAEVKKNASEDLFETAPDLVNKVTRVLQDPDQPEHSRMTTQSLFMICSRARSGKRPADPKDLDFEIDDEFVLENCGEPFYRGTISVKDRKHVIMATDAQLALLSKSKTWYIDGTFKIVKAPFTQLVSIHGFIRSGDYMKQVSLCFVYMSGKSKKDYRKTAYNKRGAVYELLRKTFSLPLVPEEDIAETFIQLKSHSNSPGTDEFFGYIERTWMASSVWPVPSWCQFGRSVRTNNDVEGWHNGLNRRAKKGNLPFYVAVTLLFKEASEVRMTTRLVKEKKLRRYQTKQTRSTEGRIWKVWNEYNKHRISTSDLLNTS